MGVFRGWVGKLVVSGNKQGIEELNLITKQFLDKLGVEMYGKKE